ncbi:hypothetical protein BX600DRAFT_466285 [Xylariales sp. PMI_506]|nr:hypothetical protein BX600DRAFT_466285 [Xylariales sp. PMI_506]
MAPSSYLTVIVPGSFAKPVGYTDLTAALKAKGQDSRTVDLPTVNDGTRLPPANVEDDIKEIRKTVVSALDDEANPQNVLLLVHSYGGIPGSSALRGLSKADRAAQGKETAVIGIIYLASWIPLEGKSLRDLAETFGLDIPEPFKSGVPGGYMPAVNEQMLPAIYSDIEDQARLAEYADVFSAHSSDSYSGLATYAAWKDIPSVTIIPGKDWILPTHIQELNYERVVKEGGKIERVFVDGASHGLSVTRVDLIVDNIVKLGSANL